MLAQVGDAPLGALEEAVFASQQERRRKAVDQARDRIGLLQKVFPILRPG
jgi:hypothetical protein